MKNAFTCCMRLCIKHTQKLPLVMTIALSFVMASTFQVFAKSNSYSSKLNVTFEDVAIEEILNEIEQQSDYSFLYRNEIIEDKRITVDVRNASIDEVLNLTLANANVEYTMLENNLVVIQPSANSSFQGVTVSGTVISISSETPLPGVNVFEKGTQNGTVTDLDGNYSITVSGSNSVLVFSFVGYLTEEVPVGDQQVIDINLSEDILDLDEVVVVGYGTMKRSDLTGAVASVSEETLRSSVATNLDQALQGRIAGVQITQNSGQPGGAASVRIRGASSITGSSEPLYVIDGIPFQGDGIQTAGFDWSGGANGQSRVNPLSTINPNDIVSIEVLKDASASAIYGARASNGVVLITTKRGSEGESKLSYNTFYALQSVPKTIEMMDLPNFAEYQLQIADELNQTPNERYLDPTLLGTGTNWQDEVFENAWTQSHQVSVTGGTAKTSYAVTGGYYGQNGIIIGSNFKRFTGRINLDSEVKDWLKVGASLSYAKTNEKITLNDGGDGVIMNALLMQPDIPVKNMDGEYAGPDVGYSGANYNPVALALLRNNTLERERLMGNIYGDAEIIKGLTFRTELGIDNNNSINKAFHPTYQFGSITNDLNKMRQRDENSFFWIWKNYLTYANTFGEKHNINAVFGYESQKSNWQGTDVTKENFASNDIHVLSQGENTTSRTNGWKGSSSLMSFFGRVNYNYDNRYLATVTLRRDGSSKFGPNNKWGNFPSASIAWRISNESFMEGVSAVRNLKIRLGFGMIGNQAIGDYLYGSSLLSLDSPFGTAYRYEKIPNPDLKWEGTQMYNIGLDLSLFAGRIDLVAELYKKKTDDMLLQLSIPSYLGGTSWEDIKSPYVNIGSMENKGVEFTLTTHNFNAKKFSWVTNLTMSFNRNKVLALDDPSTRYWENLNWYSEFQTATMTTVGEPLGVFYGYQTDGIFQNQEEILAAPVQIVDPTTVTEENPNGINLVDYTTGVWMGDLKFKDLNGDGVINTEDQTVIGDPNPDFTYGFNNVFTYGPVELTVYLQGSYGAEILNYSRVQIEGMTSPYSNQAMTVANRSRYALIDPEGDPEDPANVMLANPGTDMPRFATNDNNRNNRMSDRFIEDGTYLRIQNVSLAYIFPRNLTRKVKIDRLRIYVNGQNLYTFTKYSGYDPEIGAFDQNARKQNIDMGRYPSPRMITFGLDIDF
jgi:TonB-dependent starch-binding outer membrane protein SusC